MKPSIAIWTSSLEDKDLLVLKSALRLRNEEWVWTEAPESADLYVVDLTRTANSQRIAALDRTRLIALVDAAPPAPSAQFLHLLLKPLKAPQFMRLLDKLASLRPAQRAAPPAASAAPAPAVASQDHPWRGRKLWFRRHPNLARYPVSLELMSCIELACRSAVSYEALLQSLPDDLEMLHAILDDAARHGTLTDETGAPLAPLEERKPGAMSRFLKGFRS